MQASSRKRSSHAALAAAHCSVLIAAMLGACSGDSTRPPTGHQDQWSLLASRAWTMPADAEGYKCLGLRVTSDEYFTGFRLVSPPNAQAEVLLTVAADSSTQGSFDCNSGSLDTKLIYASSYGTTQLQFPPGYGVHVPAGKYLLLNIHVNNMSDADVSDSTRIEALMGTSSEVTKPVDMTLAGTFLINIPSDGQAHTATGTCISDADTQILAFMPLMRTAGTHQSVSVVVSNVAQPIFDQDFDSQHIVYTQPASPIAINSGDKIQVVCTYVNTSGSTLNYGESSHTESCFNAMYRYPEANSGNLFGCGLNNGNFDIRRD